jgi:hypothetical protein
MGREAICECQWKGQTAEAKVLLESRELILRGGIRARISRTTLSAVAVRAGKLSLSSGGETLTLALGKDEAEKWAAALLKPAPSLADKLGISATKKAFVIGKADDPELAKALAGSKTASLSSAAVLVAVVETEAEVQAAYKTAKTVAPCPLWCVYGKGKFATVSDAAIRSFMRDHGYIDTKTSGISDRLTATRYAPAKQAV